MEQMNAEWGEDLRRRQQHISTDPCFNTVIVILLIANTLFLGFEVDDSRAAAMGGHWLFVVLELFFALVFIGEWLLRMHQQRWGFFADNWNVFDYTLVLMGFNDCMMTLLAPVGGTQLARAFRVFRGLRVARSVRNVRSLSGLWFIIGGLLESLPTMGIVTLIVLILLYAFGVVLTTVLVTQPEITAVWFPSTMYMGTILKSMLTVLQVATLDSWAAVARPLYNWAPFAVFTMVLSVVVISFGTFNILVAIMVERISTMATDREEARARAVAATEEMLLQQLLWDFRRSDEDRSGNLSLKEFKKMIRQPRLIGKLSLLGLRVNEAEELFQLLDADDSGEVTGPELVQGIQRLRGPAKGQDMVQLISIVQKENWRSGCFVQLLKRMNQKADEIQARVNHVGSRLSREAWRVRSADKLFDELQLKAANRDSVIAEMDKKRYSQYPVLTQVTRRLENLESDFLE